MGSRSLFSHFMTQRPARDPVVTLERCGGLLNYLRGNVSSGRDTLEC